MADHSLSASEIEKAKKRIGSIVSEYIRLFPLEWEMVKQAQVKRVSNNVDEFGSFGSKDLDAHALSWIPLSLDTAFTLKLTEQENKWFNRKEAQIWFVPKFPAFRAAEKV